MKESSLLGSRDRSVHSINDSCSKVKAGRRDVYLRSDRTRASKYCALFLLIFGLATSDDTTARPLAFGPPPSFTASPTILMVPSARPTPFVEPTAIPSLFPTKTPIPSTATPSQIPTLSVAPSPFPTASPMPTRDPSQQPSHIPTVSLAPSKFPSDQPTTLPSMSMVPSLLPSISAQPSFTPVPTNGPSPSPSNSALPSSMPTLPQPSMQPTVIPPTMEPTPGGFDTVNQQRMVMTLLGLNSTIADSNLNMWRQMTSAHVREYWRGFGDDRPYYISSVTTTFLMERLMPGSTAAADADLVDGNTTSFVPPDNLEITYSQEILYQNRGPNAARFDAPTDLFTAPFIQDALSYTRAFQNASGASDPLLLNFTGIVPPPVAPAKRDKNVIAIVVVVVVAALAVASAYILYLTRFKGGEHLSRESSMQGEPLPMVISANPSDNILVSESYDDDYIGAIDSGLIRPSGNFDSGGNLRVGSGLTDTTTPDSSQFIATADGEFVSPSPIPRNISDTGAEPSPNDHYYSSSSPMQSSFHSQNSSNILVDMENAETLSPAATLGGESGDTGEEFGEDDSAGPQVPFMSGFQMEIHDLE